MKGRFYDSKREGEGAHKNDIADGVLKQDGELIIYPVIYELKYGLVREVFKERFIFIKTWGCSWDCIRCPTKITPIKAAKPMRASIDQLTDLVLNFDGDPASTAIAISGGEPLIQKEEVLKLIESIKTKTNYTVMILTNGSLIDDEFIDKANELGMDVIMISFYGLDEELHRWYTGYSNKDTLNALKLVTERFKGLITVVSIVLFNYMDMETFENTCKFLHEINPNFVIQILCSHGEEEDFFKKYHKAREIAMHYFSRVDQSYYFSTQIKMIRYQIEEDERGRMNSVKEREWKMEKEVGGGRYWLKTS